MSVTIQAADGSGGPPTLRDIETSGNEFIYTSNKLVFSGKYPGTPGEVLDLTALQALIPTGFTPVNGFLDGNGDATSKGGNGGYYTLSMFNGNPPAPNAINANYIRLWVAAGTEAGTGTYGAEALRDAVMLNLVWRKFS